MVCNLEEQQRQLAERKFKPELTGMAEELRKIMAERLRVEEELHKEHERHRMNHNASIVLDAGKSLQRPGSPRGPSGDRERLSSSHSRSSMDPFIKISSAVGITLRDPPRAEIIACRNKKDEEKRRWTNKNTQNQPIVDRDKSVKRPGPW